MFAGFKLTEGEHEIGPSRPQDSGETPDEAQAIGVGEGVEQAGVDDGIEGPAEVLHIEGVLHQERDGKIAFPRLFPGKLDRPGHRIHSPDLVTALSEKEGILPGPAPDVEDVAADLPVSSRVTNSRCGRPISQFGTPLYASSKILIPEENCPFGMMSFYLYWSTGAGQPRRREMMRWHDGRI